MYMAPEAVRGEEQGMPVDVWALGCAVIEMATGRPPWPDVANEAEGIRRIGFFGDVPVIQDYLITLFYNNSILLYIYKCV
ncbi:Mitogen-activated protein kinase kinase kinase NPK1 [Platanthera guangdongensis]|uniref:Mitogen-activated protein kinase kinase kinase NPK1 n=1 Tax=Platanthera guangdongensis TaxID=2320717 RepID=A0ABR2LS21_9ASPA